MCIRDRVCTEDTPGNAPARMFVILVAGDFINSWLSIEETDVYKRQVYMRRFFECRSIDSVDRITTGLGRYVYTVSYACLLYTSSIVQGVFELILKTMLLGEVAKAV